MHSPVHFEYPEICYPEEISKVPKVPDNQGLTVDIFAIKLQSLPNSIVAFC